MFLEASAREYFSCVGGEYKCSTLVDRNTAKILTAQVSVYTLKLHNTLKLQINSERLTDTKLRGDIIVTLLLT